MERSHKKRLKNNYEEDEEEKARPKKVPKTLAQRDTQKRLIVVLERANLETVKVGRNFELLNSDHHKHQIKDSSSAARPDITHQCLMMLLDSPLNRAGLLQVYIHSEKNVLIELHPQTRVPRTFDRFAGLMVQLLHKLSIHASDGPMKLMKVIKNPVTDHLPTGCRRISTSYHADLCTDLSQFATDRPIVFVVGAMAHGKVEVDYAEKEVAISRYPLSAALTCAKLCTAFEHSWGIV